MKIAKTLASIVATAALAVGSLVALPAAANAAAATPLVAKIADSTAMTMWPYDFYKVGTSTLVFYGKIPGTDNYGLVTLDGTTSKGLDFSGITDFGSFNDSIGGWNGKVYFSIYNTNGDIVAYSYDGTSMVQVPGLNGDDNDFYSGVEYNGDYYFRQTGLRNEGFFSDNQDLVFKLHNGVVTALNFGDANNPLPIRHGEPRGVFNGKLYIDGYGVDDYDRFLLAVDANGFTKVTATLDYQGNPTLRAMPYVSNVFVSGGYMYFGSNYEADGLTDAAWNGQNGDRGVFRMDSTGAIIRLEPTAPDRFTGRNDLTSVIEGFKQAGNTVFFQSCVMMTGACSIYRVSGTTIVYVDTFNGIYLADGSVFNNRLYIGSAGKYIGTIADNGSQVWDSQLGYLDESGNYTKVSGGAGYGRSGNNLAFAGGLLYTKPDADPRTKDDLWFTDGTVDYKIEGVRDVDFRDSVIIGSKVYFYGYSPTDPEGDYGRLMVVEGPEVPVTPVTPDPEDPNVTSVSETKKFKGTSGAITFPDGSGFDVDSKGRVYAKVSSKFLTSVSGSLKVTYKVGSATKSYTCSIKAFGSTKKLKKALTKKVLNKTKKPCQLPAPVITALKSKSITLVMTLVVKRYTSNTGLAKTSAGKVIKPVTRKMTVTMGKVVP